MISLLKSDWDWNPQSKSAGLKSESSMIWFGTHNRISLPYSAKTALEQFSKHSGTKGKIESANWLKNESVENSTYNFQN